MIEHLTQDEHQPGIYYNGQGDTYQRIRNGRGEITGFLRVYASREPGTFFSVPGASYVAKPVEGCIR